MTQQIMIGNFGSGLTQNRTAFVINNDAFPDLFNAYVWRGRVKRKRGTKLLGRLQRQLSLNSNLVGGSITLPLGPEPNAQLASGSLQLTVGANTYTEPNPPNGTLVGTPAGTGTVNYFTNVVTITGGGASPITGTYAYNPNLPVMGLRDFLAFNTSQSAFLSTSMFPLLLAFDTTYSYQVNQTTGVPFFYSTSFYKGTVQNPVTWTGADFEQFWTTNYQGALWATNGKPGFHFEHISIITTGNPTTITTAAPHNLQTNDWVFFFEVTGADANIINGQTEQVTVTGPTTFTVSINTTGKVINNSGIFQTLTNTALTLQGDGIRWYDGDPTNGTGIFAGNNLGWVNFAPPLTQTTVSIDDVVPGTYYLVGCTAIVPFKDRLLFFGPYIQTSTGNPIYLPDAVIFSWNGSPYYTSLTPLGESFDNRAYYVDQTGFGGWIAAGVEQEIITVSPNEDVLIVSFTQKHTRFAYTGDDILPFVFFSINSENLGSISTFSAINFDRGVMSIGQRGITLTNQITSQREDLQIPDQVFNVNASDNGVNRVNAIRDYLNEWAYFSYPVVGSPWKFPGQTFMYNYRDVTWSILIENYTARGYFRAITGLVETWLTLPYPSWNAWNVPWTSGQGNVEYSQVIGGNQQGFVMLQDTGTSEGTSGYVQNILAGPTSFTQFVSPDHCLLAGDYVYISDVIGIPSLNGKIGIVLPASPQAVYDQNNFTLDITFPGGTYQGNGKFTRLSVPYIQTKQFNFFWNEGRQVRLGTQKYLFDTTAAGQVTVNINLGQDEQTVYNAFPPNQGPTNTSLEYSQIVYTCPEGTNLGLTPANVNLQTLTSLPPGTPAQTWHRLNTSLQGSTVQITFTLSDAQMRDLTTATSEIALHAIQLSVGKGPLLA